MPENVRLTLAPAVSDESQKAQTASLFRGGDKPLSPHERKIYALLQGDEATHIDEIVERLEAEMSLSEIFAALFELELAGKVRQLPGKNFVRRLHTNSRRRDLELGRFLQIAMGSASEVEYHCVLAHDLGMLRSDEFDRLTSETVEVKRMLAALLGRLWELTAEA